MKRRAKIQMLTLGSPSEWMASAGLSAAIALCLCLLAVERVKPELLQGVKSNSLDIVTPVAHLIAAPKETLADWAARTRAFFNTYEENAALKLANAELLKWQAAAKELRYENEELRSLLHMVPDSNVHYVTTRIVSDISATSSFTALISAGVKEGIKKNQAVINSEGLIGRVIEAGEHNARVLLLADSNSHIPVIGERGRHKAMLSGRGRGDLTLRYVERGDQFAVGERLITSGDGGLLPPGILVGSVSTVDGVNVGVRPMTNADSASIVTVVDYRF